MDIPRKKIKINITNNESENITAKLSVLFNYMSMFQYTMKASKIGKSQGLTKVQAIINCYVYRGVPEKTKIDEGLHKLAIKCEYLLCQI